VVCEVEGQRTQGSTEKGLPDKKKRGASLLDEYFHKRYTWDPADLPKIVGTKHGRGSSKEEVKTKTGDKVPLRLVFA